MKPGTEYELFVKEVYEYLNRASGLTDVVIKHNVVLTGISGIPRQIDVFWSFKRAGIPYKVAIECKDYSRSVSIEKISAFHDVLNDLGDVKGIFATRAGFQTGAIEWARKYGIQPMIIRHPAEEDWTGRIKDIHLQFEITSIENIRPQIIVNKEKSLGMEIPDGFHGFSDSVTIQFDELTTIDGKTIENESVTMQDLIHKLPTEDGPSQNNTYHAANAV